MVYCIKKGEMSMTVDPKQVKDLVTTFCELNEEYREKAYSRTDSASCCIYPISNLFKEIEMEDKILY